MSEQPVVRLRRVRYQGTHPRNFNEKYKELNPEKYSGEIAKVIARGHTPAGAHLPICVNEVIEVLHPKPGEIGLDATLGFGGHSRELLSRISPGGKLFAIDVDADELKKTETRLRAEGFDETILSVRQLNFAGVCKLMPDVPNGFDFIMADLGISSMQLDNPQRGFSLKVDGPLDLRLNQQRGTTAAELLQSLTAPEIEKLLRLNSDEPFSAKIAKKIYTARSLITTTAALTEIVRAAITEANQKIDDRNITKSIKRTFQALRIAVNGEFFVLEQFLNSLPLILKSGGRIAILSFHSGEDKRVKAAFSAGFEAGVYTDFCRFSIHASAQERYDNPRSKAAVLRWAVRS